MFGPFQGSPPGGHSPRGPFQPGPSQAGPFQAPRPLYIGPFYPIPIIPSPVFPGPAGWFPHLPLHSGPFQNGAPFMPISSVPVWPGCAILQLVYGMNRAIGLAPDRGLQRTTTVECPVCVKGPAQNARGEDVRALSAKETVPGVATSRLLVIWFGCDEAGARGIWRPANL